MDDTDDLKRRLASPALVASLLGLQADPGELARRRRSQRSSRVMVLCPSHAERTASCSLTVGDDGTLAVHCFAGGAACLDGDVFTLIAAVERIDDFRAVLARARSLAGVSPFTPIRFRPPPPPPPPVSTPPSLSDAAFAALLDPLLRGAVVGRQPDVARYLEARLLRAEAEADGWAALPPAHEQGRWLARLCTTGAGGAEAVGRSGLVPLDDDDQPRFDRFAQPGARIVIPWRASGGALLTVQRRRLDAGGEGRPRYVAARGRPPRSLYGTERVTEDRARPITIVEGAMDVLARRVLVRLASLPPEDVVGLPGTGAWSPALLPPCHRRVVHVATDADEAGEACARRIAGDVSAAGGVPIRVTPAAGCKDWGEVLERLANKGRCAA